MVSIKYNIICNITVLFFTILCRLVHVMKLATNILNQQALYTKVKVRANYHARLHVGQHLYTYVGDDQV